MQPLHYDLRDPDAKDTITIVYITHAAAATSNLDAAIPMRFATTASRNAKNYAHRNNHSLQNTEEEPIASGTTSHFTRKNTRFRAPASSPTQSPCNIHAAILNAICNHSFKKRKELRTQEQPLVAEHRGGTNRVQNDHSRNRHTHEVPFIAGCSHFTRKKTMFHAPASSPQQSPLTIHAPSSPLPFLTTTPSSHHPSSRSILL